MITELYRLQEKRNADLGQYAIAIEYNAKGNALEEIMKEAERISNCMKTETNKLTT